MALIPEPNYVSFYGTIHCTVLILTLMKTSTLLRIQGLKVSRSVKISKGLSNMETRVVNHREALNREFN